jgi:hypothetical protein
MPLPPGTSHPGDEIVGAAVLAVWSGGGYTADEDVRSTVSFDRLRMGRGCLSVKARGPVLQHRPEPPNRMTDAFRGRPRPPPRVARALGRSSTRTKAGPDRYSRHDRLAPYGPQMVSDGGSQRATVRPASRSSSTHFRCDTAGFGGGRGIRTHVRVAPEAVFKTAAIGH